MIWQNPWAWVGLGFLALPVLIHLLGRGEAPRRPFPTLRFLPPSRSMPTRRKRIREPLLLAVRLSVLASAVVALAQPFFVTNGRRSAASRGLARAFVVDTSESMRRAGPTGARPMDSARADAQRLATEAQTSVIIQSSSPRRALAGAAEWIARQQRRAELVIVSDFQTGTIDERDLAAVPRSVGVRLLRVAAVPPGETVARTGDLETLARVTPASNGSTIEWTTRAPAAGTRSSILILAGAAERAGVEAAQRAAASLGARVTTDSAREIAIVYGNYDGRAEVLAKATPIKTPWMAAVVVRLRADSMLIGAAATVVPTIAADSSGKFVVARGESGKPIAVAAQAPVDGRERLVLLPLVDAGSLTSAALIAAAARAVSPAIPPGELDPTTLPDDVIRAWQREPDANAVPRGNTDGASDGRWFWLIALALLGVETWLRRERREEVVQNMVRDRAA